MITPSGIELDIQYRMATTTTHPENELLSDSCLKNSLFGYDGFSYHIICLKILRNQNKYEKQPLLNFYGQKGGEK